MRLLPRPGRLDNRERIEPSDSVEDETESGGRSVDTDVRIFKSNNLLIRRMLEVGIVRVRVSYFCKTRLLCSSL